MLNDDNDSTIININQAAKKRDAKPKFFTSEHLKTYKDFFDIVFKHHTGIGEPCVYITPPLSAPTTMPIPVKASCKALQRYGADNPKQIYFNISTLRPAIDGTHTKSGLANFGELVMVYLDDIGDGANSKIAFEDLPRNIPFPTYMLETSEGNFQYGYVLSEPIKDRELAKTFVKEFVNEAYSDTGGRTCMKKLRAPCGIHGKKESLAVNFRSELDEIAPTYFTPDELLKAFGSKYTLEQLELVSCETDFVQKERTEDRTQEELDALVQLPKSDPNYKLFNFIIQKAGLIYYGVEKQFHIFDCPWSHEHTTGDSKCAVSFAGEGAHKDFLIFKCLHGHCEKRKGKHFIEYMVGMGFQSGAEFDPSCSLIRNYALNVTRRQVIHIDEKREPQVLTFEGFLEGNNEDILEYYPHKSGANSYTVKTRMTTPAERWRKNTARQCVRGVRNDYSTSERIIKKDGVKYANGFAPPELYEGEPPDDMNAFFDDFFTYLFPHEHERDLILQQYAAKLRDMSFRGWAQVLYAPAQGTGRGSLFLLLQATFNECNTAVIGMADIVGENSKYNDYLAKAIVLIREAPSAGSMSLTLKNRYMTMLNEAVDTTAVTARLNPKGRAHYEHSICAMTIIATNEEDAIPVSSADRRFFFARCCGFPRGSDYFKKFHDLLRKTDENGVSVLAKAFSQYLQQIPVDYAMLNGRAPQTDSHIVQVAQSLTLTERFFELYVLLLIAEKIPVTYLALFEQLLSRDTKSITVVMLEESHESQLSELYKKCIKPHRVGLARQIKLDKIPRHCALLKAPFVKAYSSPDEQQKQVQVIENLLKTDSKNRRAYYESVRKKIDHMRIETHYNDIINVLVYEGYL